MKTGTTAETRNVTLALSRSLLRKVKLLAVERDTSISGLLTEFLEEIVKKHDGYAWLLPEKAFFPVAIS